MDTLNQNELGAVCGGLDPLNTQTPADDWALQWFMDQLAQQEEAQSLRHLLGGSAE